MATDGGSQTSFRFSILIFIAETRRNILTMYLLARSLAWVLPIPYYVRPMSSLSLFFIFFNDAGVTSSI